MNKCYSYKIKVLFKLIILGGGIFLLASSLIVVMTYYLFNYNHARFLKPIALHSQVGLGQTEIRLEVVDTESAREQGLSGRQSLDTHSGMLFIFPEQGTWQFWMKDMHFPLDIIWLDQDFAIVDIKPDLQPNSYPESFTSRNKALYVIEVNAGFSHEYNLKVGNKLDIEKKPDGSVIMKLY